MIDEIKFILEDLKRTKKAVVALGCSFVYGSELTGSLEEKRNKTFVNVLCNDFLNKSYTPINFGQEGSGNFGAISKLFLYEIPWSELEDIIVIFIPSGLERFDVIKDDDSAYFGREFNTIWPGSGDISTSNHNWKALSKLFNLNCYSFKFEVINTSLNFQILNSWVSQYKAKLIVFPAFDSNYSKEYFLEKLKDNVYRNDHKLVSRSILNFKSNFSYNFLVESVPWNKFVTIENSSTFFELCFKKDKNYFKNFNIVEVIVKKLMYSNEWIMPGGHPSEKGHRLLAEHLYTIIKDTHSKSFG